MLQTGEIIVIVLLALVVLGPTRLPDMARKVGRWTNELRSAARDITRGLESEVAQIKDVGRELQGPLDEIKKPLTEIKEEMSGFSPGGHEWKGPKPVSGPTPDDAMRDLEELNRAAAEAGVDPDSVLDEAVVEIEEPDSDPDGDNESRE